MKRAAIGILFVTACTLATVPSVPQSGISQIYIADTPDVLKDIRSLGLVFSFESKELNDQGSKTEDYRTAIELILRQNGIKVLSPEEGIKATNVPVLGVTLATMPIDDLPVYAYSLSISIHENVKLARNPFVNVLGAATYRRSFFGYVGKFRSEGLRDQLKTSIEPFLNDYLKANPKK